MDYEKKYKEALRKATKIHRDDNEEIKHYMEVLFPELAESEDERIRKELVAFLEELSKLGKDTNFDRWKTSDCANWIAWLEKQGEQPKKHDKVEPKFKIGDWVIDKQGIVHQIANVTEIVTCHTYGYDIVGGGYFNDNTEGVRLWTIQDAKDGDVLVDKYNNIGIFQECKGICWHSHIYLGCNGELRGFNIGDSHEQTGTHPATKEQRDFLFQKMKEAGYKWDEEKKGIEDD